MDGMGNKATVVQNDLDALHSYWDVEINGEGSTNSRVLVANNDGSRFELGVSTLKVRRSETFNAEI